ncbi:protein SCAI [Chytriomyces cf. hyalinus JEL632]|nr:protein SCAI [Chytriomyces cf. hyalinus JEL632]
MSESTKMEAEPTPVQTEAPAGPVAAASAVPVAHSNAKIVEEFQYLLEKSQQLFAGLRDLPPTGKNWQPYFQRTFEVYTKLWKFQQTHRLVLENKDLYGLKRYEIGEIASKIGQLYYHYYLRTSETNYLYESYVFYEAIRERQYFRDVLDAKNPPLMIKKLRYYARFIVVCLLLNSNETIKKLMEELTGLIDEYTKTFKPSDGGEWNVVLSEITTFLEAEKRLTPVNPEDPSAHIIPPQSRLPLSKHTPLVVPGADGAPPQPKLKLQEAILVGNYANQIKFSELTLDMYRMLQSLEREPSVSGKGGAMAPPQHDAMAVDGEAGGAGDEKGVSSKRSNPHKYLLYRPTLAQLTLYIATAFKDINENSALLLYLSADGSKRQGAETSGYNGGVATAVNYSRSKPDKTDADQTNLIHSLHPGDLVPFMRKPLFVVIDSTNSAAFKSTPHVFNQAFVCLMSPVEYPSTLKDTSPIGSLFTLFLNSPIKGFAFINDIPDTQVDTWSKCYPIFTQMEKMISDAFDASTTLDKSFKRFLQDDFLRQILVRFAVCSGLLCSHVGFKEAKYLPCSEPALPSASYLTPEVITKFQELVGIANVAQSYNFTADAVQ